MSILRTFLFVTLFSILLSLLFRIVGWLNRIRSLQRSIPVIPVLFPHTSLFRFLIPKKWQTFHIDWHIQHGRIIYQNHNSDIIALVSLFEEDKIFISDPNAIIEIKVTGAHRFQIDSEAIAKVSPLRCINKTAIYGPNVEVSTSGKEWKLHRKFASLAFPQKTIQLVHSETTKQTIQMLKSWEKISQSESVLLEESVPCFVLRIVSIKTLQSWL
jgi:cytochrome P450